MILYGCGDLITDYEGITGYEAYRGDLGLMYFPTVDSDTGRLVRLEMIPTEMRRFRINRAVDADARWLGNVLTHHGQEFGTSAGMGDAGRVTLRWA